MSNRKPEEGLTERDFQASPVWRFCTEDEDSEAMVEPCPDASVSFGDPVTYLVAAKAVLANGGACSGFVRMGRLLNFVDEGPLTLFLNGRQCEIEASIPGWAGTKPVSATEKRLLPIRWSVGVTAVGEKAPRAGSVSRSRLVYFLRSTLRGLRIQGMRSA